MFPAPFIENLNDLLGKDRADSLLKTLDSEPPVSIRINPSKLLSNISEYDLPIDDSNKTMSQYGYFLSNRPSFTLNPLLHQGAFYVQEASSMALEKVLSLNLPIGECLLDLCAAPGGKSTHLLSMIKNNPSSFLVSNEVISSRATILSQNIAKWGESKVVVTNNDPSDFSSLVNFFDTILVDAPCSGEGMFRKDIASREQWSPENQKLCASRQRRIVSDVMPALSPGGIFIYSTCTFNTMEDEDNVSWMESQFDLDLKYMHKFFPSEPLCGEGFFIAIFQKRGESGKKTLPRFSVPERYSKKVDFVKPEFDLFLKGDLLKAYPREVALPMQYIESKLKVIRSATAVATIKGKDFVPEAEFALSMAINSNYYHSVEVDKATALSFLSKGNILLKDEPLGYILLKYKGLPLGFVKNLGNRSNNLWYTSWRIKML